MDVRLSDEQQALRDSVAKVTADLGPGSVGGLDDVERAAKLDAAIAAAGWRELRMDDDGAPLASGVEAAIVAEELARGLADAAFVGPVLAGDLRRLAGAPEANDVETVAFAAELDDIACLAADASPDGVVAIDAAAAGTALAFTPAPGGHALVELDLTAEREAVDLTRPSAVFSGTASRRALHGTFVADADHVGWQALGLALTCADLVGAMRGAVELTVDYAAERRQYGTEIGSFQAVQHLLADAHVAAEGSASATLHAAWAVDALEPHEARHAGHVAKAYCVRAARSVCETAIQVHGGIGNTWECLAHVYLRRALLSSDVLGGAGASLEHVLARVLDDVSEDREIGADHGLR
ncbi:MAG: acyl-CoA dehydrogenase family protein [Acidimicrobiales bacterium]|nr:acyl-CoA dehydrogenase family protein [Acidimicrobiales bacterium]